MQYVTSQNRNSSRNYKEHQVTSPLITKMYWSLDMQTHIFHWSHCRPLSQRPQEVKPPKLPHPLHFQLNITHWPTAVSSSTPPLPLTHTQSHSNHDLICCYCKELSPSISTLFPLKVFSLFTMRALQVTYCQNKYCPTFSLSVFRTDCDNWKK